MTPGERRPQIGSWPAIEQAVQHGRELKVWYSPETKLFRAFVPKGEESFQWATGLKLEWALDHLENELNDEP